MLLILNKMAVLQYNNHVKISISQFCLFFYSFFFFFSIFLRDKITKPIRKESQQYSLFSNSFSTFFQIIFGRRGVYVTFSI